MDCNPRYRSLWLYSRAIYIGPAGWLTKIVQPHSWFSNGDRQGVIFAVTEVLPQSPPIVSPTGTGFLIPLKLAPFAVAAKV